jgi:hypothetical protein
MKTMYRTYSELVKLQTFEERFKYLQLNGQCSEITFGGHRLLNQMLYKSPQWLGVRQRVIIRDEGCDLGIKDRPINDRILIHHINPITIDQVQNFDPCVFDMDNLICVTKTTHDQIHYGDGSKLIPTQCIERKPGDTKLW